MTLVGRAVEDGALQDVLAGVRDGLSGVLVLRGEAGIGKTALLEHLAGQAADVQVAWVTGVESEMDLGFAGLHQLLVPFLGNLDRLPGPQWDALGAAFGLAEGPAPDRFLVGLAALTLLTEATAERPVLCVVDDAQWLDRVSLVVLGFVARRLLADRVGMVFGVRAGDQQTATLEGLPELTVGALPEEAAGELLAVRVGGPVDPQVRQRILAEADGNPLALLEFAGELTEAEVSGAMPLRGPLRSGGRLEELYVSRVRALPEQAQLLLLIAAADELGGPAKVWRAAGQLGIDAEVAELPEVDRLVWWTPRVKFRHPLMRSAAYYAAPVAARRRAHAALAAVSDPERDPDRRAWHLAAAASGPDEQVAAQLEASAGRARARGGWASSAASLERAAELTPDTGRRGRRLLEAAEARLTAGEAPVARKLAQRAAPLLADPLARARSRRLEGQTAYAAGQMPQAIAALLDAAAMLRTSAPRLARDTLLDAFTAAQFSGRPGAGMAEVLAAVRAVPRAADSQPTLADLLLDGFAAVAEYRYENGAALLRRAIAPLVSDRAIPDDYSRHIMAIAAAATLLYDDAALHQLERWWVPELRDRGAFAALLAALLVQMAVQVGEGRFADAAATRAEGQDLSKATGYLAYQSTVTDVELLALAWQGREADTRPLAARLLGDSVAQGDENAVRVVHVALSVLEVSLGNYAEALSQALKASPANPVLGSGPVENLVEAGVRCGDRQAAAAALEAFVPQALASGTHSALGLLARSRALLAADDQAETDFQRSVEHLGQSRTVPQLARSYLVYGEWLRRQRRRRDARDQLRTAFAIFDRSGMHAFADRARSELRATGEHAARHSPGAQDDALTPQETQIARLAAGGATSAEIAARLFISAATVDYHLCKIFRKLDISSRVQLARALADTDDGTRVGVAVPRA